MLFIPICGAVTFARRSYERFDRQKEGTHMLRVGTSGYSYEDWKGFYYPENIKQSDMLPFYARDFETVEINYTYIPHASRAYAWRNGRKSTR